MIKEFFLVDYNSINSFKEISEPLLDMATSSFLVIAAIFELFKGFIGKSNVESRVTIFILAAISMSAFNQYNQKVLDLSFQTSDKILSKLHITSMTKISDIMKSTPADQIEKDNQANNEKTKLKPEATANILGEARIFIANNLAIAVAWLISVIAIGLSRILFTVIYYALIVLSPIIIFISVFPGFEGSLKAFWQAFIWCFLAPIVFSVIFVLMHLIAQKENPSGLGGLESLINVLLYGIFLVGSFIMTYKISTSQPLTGFAEKASMVGAMAMAAPFTSVSTFAQSAIHSPLQTYANTKLAMGKMQNVVEKLSNNHTPHSGIGDISKMSHEQVGKKFGGKAASKIYSDRAMNDYMGNRFGLTSPSGSSNTTPAQTSSVLNKNANTNGSASSNPAFNNRKFDIDPNTLNAREVYSDEKSHMGDQHAFNPSGNSHKRTPMIPNHKASTDTVSNESPALSNRKYEFDPNTLNAREIVPKQKVVTTNATDKNLQLPSKNNPRRIHKELQKGKKGGI